MSGLTLPGAPAAYAPAKCCEGIAARRPGRRLTGIIVVIQHQAVPKKEGEAGVAGRRALVSTAREK